MKLTSIVSSSLIMCSTLSSIHSVSVSSLLCSLTGFSIFLHTTALTRVKPLPTPLLSYNKCLQSPRSFQYSQFSLCILYILGLYPLYSGSVFYNLVLYLLCVIKYVSSWSSAYLYIHNSLIVSLLYSRSCSVSSIHNSVSDYCIQVLYLLYSGSLSSVIKYVSSWSSTYLYIHNSLIFSLLYSMPYSLSSIHVYIYLQFNHLSVPISTCFSLQCLVCSAHIFRYSIVSAPDILLSNSLQLLSQVHRDEYSNNPSAEIFSTCQCQLSTLHFMSLFVYNSLTFHLQSIVSSNMI